MPKIYFIVPMESLSTLEGYEPMITTAVGHSTDGTTIVKYEQGSEPPELTDPLTEEEFLALVSPENSGWVNPLMSEDPGTE